MWDSIFSELKSGNLKALARAISFIENEYKGYDSFLQNLGFNATPIIGITGPPGAGKSTLVDACIAEFVKLGKRVAVVCVDPSSPFNLGAVLGDRIRMSQWYTHPNVFIRSLATRGSLGGLHPKIIEITEVIKAGKFDYIIIETVGVGQSEIEIVGLADATVVVLVPEAGDEVQTMKAGLMEIANIFVVNKSDRPEADKFTKHLKTMLAPAFNKATEVKIIKTVANKKEGIEKLIDAITASLAEISNNDKKNYLIAERVFNIIRNTKMKAFDKKQLLDYIKQQKNKNLYVIANHFLNTNF
jgi:LAO/AO transport system kinase